jgi:hypothetical protein
MTTPSVTELSPTLEPVSRDPFIDAIEPTEPVSSRATSARKPGLMGARHRTRAILRPTNDDALPATRREARHSVICHQAGVLVAAIAPASPSNQPIRTRIKTDRARAPSAE